MCGIAGYLFPSSTAPSTEALSAAKIALDHRGPDDSGLFEERAYGVGLAHTRLSFLGLSPSGHQPMTNEDGSVVLVFNGEIYNFQETRSNLEQQGAEFRGTSDTEVLMPLYLLEGNDQPKMLRHLNGIFAFAIWDGRSQKLIVVRDALGIKPLYYSESGGCVLSCESY